MPDPVLRFQYPGIDADDGRNDEGKRHFYLCKADLLVSEIQIFEPGAHVNLHTHLMETGVWIVLSGTFTFYGEGDTIYGELGKYEGLLIPAGSKYWFENTGDEPAEIMRVDCHTPPGARISPEPQKVMNAFGTARWSSYADAAHEQRRPRTPTS